MTRQAAFPNGGWEKVESVFADSTRQNLPGLRFTRQLLPGGGALIRPVIPRFALAQDWPGPCDGLSEQNAPDSQNGVGHLERRTTCDAAE